MKKKEILFIGTSSFNPIKKNILEKINRLGVVIKYNPYKRKMTDGELVKVAKNAKYIIAGTENYSQSTLLKLKYLKILYRLGSGTDNVNLRIIKSLKIKFFKSKKTPEKAVAELIVLFILGIYRSINEHNYNLRRRIWKKKTGLSLFGKTVGIIGYGKVGKYLKNLLKNFGVKFLIYDIKKIKINSSLEKVLKYSDIISLNLSVKNTKYLIDKKKMKLLKKNSIIINTSRPEVIDYDYLFHILKKKKILGAGLDVFEKEPYYGKLIKLENVMLTPHIAGSTIEIRKEMENEAIKKLINEIKN